MIFRFYMNIYQILEQFRAISFYNIHKWKKDDFLHNQFECPTLIEANKRNISVMRRAHEEIRTQIQMLKQNVSIRFCSQFPTELMDINFIY